MDTTFQKNIKEVTSKFGFDPIVILYLAYDSPADMMLDFYKNTNMLLNTPFNRNLWKDNPKKYDLRGIDTKDTIGSVLYQRAFAIYQKQKHKKILPKKLKIRSARTNEQIISDWERNLPESLKHTFESPENFLDFTNYLPPAPPKPTSVYNPEDIADLRKEEEKQIRLSYLKKLETMLHSYKTDGYLVGATKKERSAQLAQFKIDATDTLLENWNRFMYPFRYSAYSGMIKEEYIEKQKLKQKVIQDRIRSLSLRKNQEIFYPKTKEGKIILPRTYPNWKRLYRLTDRGITEIKNNTAKYVLAEGQKIILPDLKKNRELLQKFYYLQEIFILEPIHRKKPRRKRTLSINERLRDLNAIHDHLASYHIYQGNEEDDGSDVWSEALHNAVYGAPRDPRNPKRLHKQSSVEEIYWIALENKLDKYHISKY